MAGLALFGLIWGILSLTSGDDVGFGIMTILSVILGGLGGWWAIALENENK